VFLFFSAEAGELSGDANLTNDQLLSGGVLPIQTKRLQDGTGKFYKEKSLESKPSMLLLFCLLFNYGFVYSSFN